MKWLSILFLLITFTSINANNQYPSTSSLEVVMTDQWKVEEDADEIGCVKCGVVQLDGQEPIYCCAFGDDCAEAMQYVKECLKSTLEDM
ncbi:MAG: hypothetical protein LCH44_10205 [Bacteroidetes bacterium]|jgi:hypothetical protein|nr:hypothetical protein [Bacteroidota bacterium]